MFEISSVNYKNYEKGKLNADVVRTSLCASKSHHNILSNNFKKKVFLQHF